MQNDFADPKGSLYVRGAEELAGAVNEQVRRAAGASAFVVYTQDWHPERTPHFANYGGIWPVHCVAGSWGARLVGGLVVSGPVVHKGSGNEDGYSGFGARDVVTGEERPTELAGLLLAHGVRRLAVAGLATDYCVKYTALDALALGFTTSVLVRCCKAVDLRPGDGEAAIDEVRRAGAEVVLD